MFYVCLFFFKARQISISVVDIIYKPLAHHYWDRVAETYHTAFLISHSGSVKTGSHTGSVQTGSHTGLVQTGSHTGSVQTGSHTGSVQFNGVQYSYVYPSKASHAEIEQRECNNATRTCVAAR